MELTIKEATEYDVDALAEMNKQLIEDEGSRNPMTVEQLTERMMSMLKTGWKVLLISNAGEDLGYMVFKESPDEYFPDQSEVYIRQYFVKRQYRSAGLGATAFKAICSNYFSENLVLTLDVLEVNPKGRRFWEKVGFEPYLTHMKKKNSKPSN